MHGEGPGCQQDLYFAEDITALQCEMFIERDGVFEGGCITWLDAQDSDGKVLSGQLTPGGCG
jgi:hypothetical protein